VGHLPDGKEGIPILNSSAPPRICDAFVERFVVEAESAGPLRGTSFAVKDIFDVAGRPSGCGNPTWRATHPAASSSAEAVRRLLRAGARLVGKTRTDELAYSLDGCNFHEGAPENPAAPERLTGGSSSGAASAVAARAVAFAIASDTAGSVRVPAAWCGLIGMRPTHARIPVAGLMPLAPSFDTVGWLARSASLMRKVGAALFGESATPASALSLVRDPRIESLAEPETAAALRREFERWTTHGARLDELALDIDLAGAAECLRVLQAHEVWNTHGQWIESFQPNFGPGVAERFAAARMITADQVREAARQRTHIAGRLDAVLPAGRILCLPAAPGPAPRRDASTLQLQLSRTRLLPLTALASLTGRPQITLPLALGNGTPVGVSLLGWKNGDEALLDIAERFSPS
jgi:amidase